MPVGACERTKVGALAKACARDKEGHSGRLR